MIIGIDNGLDGGLVAISQHTGGIISKTIMPTMHRAGKREVNTLEIYKWVTGLHTPFCIAIEEPLKHAPSSQAVRSMAISFGKILGMAECKDWNIQCVEVRKWQKGMLGSIPQGHTKKAALALATKIAPDECWRKSKRASIPHDGMIDAFLIARYVREKSV